MTSLWHIIQTFFDIDILVYADCLFHTDCNFYADCHSERQRRIFILIRSTWYSQDLVCAVLIYEKAQFRGGTGVFVGFVHPNRPFRGENGAAQSRHGERQTNSPVDLGCEREILVCVYWSVAMGIYLMICSEVTVCIPSVADASYGGSAGNATFSY